MTPSAAPVVLAADDGSRALVSPFGAHVLSWTTPEGRERLYLSRGAMLDGSAAIRGGIPVIFPQFAAEGPLPKHGFARTATWRLLPDGAGEHTPEGSRDARATARGTAADVAAFELTDSPGTRATWPHAFRARLTVALRPGTLDVVLAVTNPGRDSLSFTAALHTYLAMDDAFAAEVLGLERLSYRDSITRAAGRQREQVLKVGGAVNRVYAGAPPRIEVRDGSSVMTVETSGFRDAVVWNPGAEGEAALGDVEVGDARRMLCVEPATIEVPVVLAPGVGWEGTQRLTAR